MMLRRFLFPLCQVNDPAGILPPVGDDVPHPTPGGKRALKCEHCDCQLTPAGDVLRMSDTARSHLKAAEKIEKFQARISELESDLREARAKIAELTVPATATKGLSLEF